jgi:hypothetical protein
MLTELVRRLLRAAPAPAARSWIDHLATLDRYQASDGIEQAATFVAQAAADNGFRDVCIHRYPADGARRWWSFEAPTAWTVAAAKLVVRASGDTIVCLDHEALPMALASYSRSTGGPQRDVRVVRLADAHRVNCEGALVLVGADDYRPGATEVSVTSLRAIGFLTDGATRTVDGASHRGRLELRAGGALLAFSLTTDEVATISDCLTTQHVVADVDVALEHRAMMPVVTGLASSEGGDAEIWLGAHLCHPRPGANDNASGVAALLGVAGMLGRPTAASSRPPTTVRAIWGPEYVGTVAALASHLAAGLEPPSCYVNLDMVGEDQLACRSPFVVERAPDWMESPLSALAEAAVGEVFEQTADDGGVWRASPFLGFSDHALFADSSLNRPSLQLCHPGDRFNHSAGDTPDKVSEIEMRRSMAAASAIVEVLRSRSAAPCRELTVVAVDRWCDSMVSEVEHSARSRPSAWSSQLSEYVASRCRAMRSAAVSGDDWLEPSPWLQSTGCRRWQGPLNLRALVDDCSASTRAEILRLVAADKMNLAVLLQVAVRCGHHTDLRRVVDDTCLALRRPIDQAVADVFVGAILESGWVAA